MKNLKFKKIKNKQALTFKSALKFVSPEPCENDVFPKVGLALIFGLEKVGKTSLILYKIVKNLKNFKKVFYVWVDNTPRDLYEKFNALALNELLKEELSKKIKFLIPPVSINLILPKFKKGNLIVIDPLYALDNFLKINLNDFKSVINILIKLRNSALKKHCAVWLTHHTRKSGDSPLGSQAFCAVADLLGNLEKIENKIKITYKARYFIDMEMETFIFKKVGNQKILEFSLDLLTPEAEKILLLCEEETPLSLNTLCNKLPFSRSKIYRLINSELISNNFLKLKGSGKKAGYMLTELGKKVKDQIQKKLEEEYKKETSNFAKELGDYYLTEFEKSN